MGGATPAPDTTLPTLPTPTTAALPPTATISLGAATTAPTSHAPGPEHTANCKPAAA